MNMFICVCENMLFFICEERYLCMCVGCGCVKVVFVYVCMSMC